MNNIIEELITTGERASSDNAILTNCSEDFIRLAHRHLNNEDSIRAIKVVFNEQKARMIQDLFHHFDDYARRIFSRAYVASEIVLAIFDAYPEIEDFRLGFTRDTIMEGLSAFKNKDYTACREYYKVAPLASDIREIVDEFGKAELNIFITAPLNKYIQQEINNQIGSRLPYCVKIFTTLDRLTSYSTTNHEFIQSPHDYISYDYNVLESRTVQ